MGISEEERITLLEERAGKADLELEMHMQFARGWRLGSDNRCVVLERKMNKLELTMHELNGVVAVLQLSTDLAAKERRKAEDEALAMRVVDTLGDAK